MTFFDFFQFLSGDVWIYIASFILILSLLVFVHEWGHYIVARMCGVRVETFSIGFGKELFGVNDKNGTRWKFSLIPLGGYVQLFGHENPAEENLHDKKKEKKKAKKLTKKELSVAFFAKPVWKRAAVVFAGPAINYIFAIFLFTILFTVHGEPVTRPSAGAVITGSAAEKAGFKPGDLVLKIDGQEIDSFEQIRREMMISLNRTRSFEVDRGGELITLEATPEKVEVEDRFGFKHSKGLLGLIGPRYAIPAKNIIQIDNQKFEAGQVEKVLVAIKSKMGRSFTILTAENKTKDKYVVRPAAGQNEELYNKDSDEYGLLFISDVESKVFVRYGVFEAFYQSLVEAKDVTVGTLEALGQMITGTRSATELGGIIRIGALAGDMVQQGIIALLMFTALLSINLGLINLFPIPLLDGGHLLFYAVEAVLGKPIPDKFQEYAFQAGLFFLISVMAFANINDIIQLIL